MKLSINEKNPSSGPACLELKGEFTIKAVKKLKAALEDLLKKNPSFDIDVSGVEKIDTAGFQLLLSAIKSGEKVSIIDSGEKVRKVFAFYGEKI